MGRRSMDALETVHLTDADDEMRAMNGQRCQFACTLSWKKIAGVGLALLVVGCAAAFAARQDRKGSHTRPSPLPSDARIKHIVVLYQENRAFDHMFGWSGLKGIEGLTGEETNPIDPNDPGKGSVKVLPNASYIAVFDPNHEMKAYDFKTFGKPGMNQSDPKMNGFFAWEAQTYGAGGAHFVMEGFAEDKLTVSRKLAEEYAIFDHWYTAFPGPSWPNHMFTMAGTPGGNTNTGYPFGCDDKPYGNGSLFPQKTIFQSLSENGLPWKLYYQDSRADLQLAFLQSREAAENTWPYDTFLQDAKQGTLPTLSWISPRWGVNKSLGDWGGPNSDHPSCCDIALGEHLRKEIYEAVRAGPGWNDTLILYMWDDPGGFYDHVKPPMSAPRPDNYPSCPDEGFQFDRLGSRVPVIAVSPWLNRGTVVGDPDGPEPDSKYDSTSLIGTMKEMYHLPSFLTARDKWSGKFHHLFKQREKPRSDQDCPKVMPAAPKPGAWGNVTRGQKGLYDDDCDQPSRSQRRAIQLTERILGTMAPANLHVCAHKEPHWQHKCPEATRIEATEWLRATTEEWRRRALASTATAEEQATGLYLAAEPPVLW